NQDDWRNKVRECLVRDSEVILESSPDDLPKLRKSLMDVMTVPIDSGYLLLHPKINRVDRRTDSVEIVLSLPEGVQ
ncbi:MAG: hypothetical protein ABGZ35_04175, partial [Planctomycetaceae bacterium]